MESFEPGREILGKYRVEGVIGRGGMGVVLRAAHVELDTHVAIKVLSSATSADVAARFLREAKAASKLRSEFVARVTDYGRLDDGQPCMVMELLDGEDYGAILERGPLPIVDAVDAIVQAAAALAEAHAAGIVHRDIKPSNLFRTVRPDGSHCAKVLDFGISKLLAQAADQALTDTGHVLGTPLYMSPEQVRSPKEIDARTDVWSLGGVLYEMLAGQPPFHADTLGVVFARILETAPRPLAEHRPDVPAALAEIVHRCLEKDRERRVASMRELASLLVPFASGEGAVAARRAGIVAAPGITATPRIDEPARTSLPEGALASPDTSALAETLDAAAIDADRTGHPRPVPAATRASVPEVRSDARAAAAGAGAPAAATSPARSRLSILLAAGIAAAVAIVAVLGTQGDRPAGDPASAGSPPTPPATLTAAPTVTPAATPLDTPSPAGSSTASAAATAPATGAADPTSTAAASASTAAASAASTAIPTASPRPSATAAASARKPGATASPGSTPPQPSATSLW